MAFKAKLQQGFTQTELLHFPSQQKAVVFSQPQQRILFLLQSHTSSWKIAHNKSRISLAFISSSLSSQHAQGEPWFITVSSQLNNFPYWKSWLGMLHCNFSCAAKGSFLKASKPERCLLPPQGSCPTGKPKYFILKGDKFRDCWQMKPLKTSLLISFINVSFLI